MYNLKRLELNGESGSRLKKSSGYWQGKEERKAEAELDQYLERGEVEEAEGPRVGSSGGDKGRKLTEPENESKLVHVIFSNKNAPLLFS